MDTGVAVSTAGAARGCHVVVIGVGNIGSHLVPLLARHARIRRLTLVDPGVFEAPNRATQDVVAGSIGRSKVEVVAERVREIDSTVSVTTFARMVEDVPLGRLRGDLLVSAPDTRRARVSVNRAAWRLGTGWIDAGVDAGGGLARVTTWLPSAEAACCQCAFGPIDYSAMAQEYACAGRTGGGMPSGASAGLGSLAASMQALAACRHLEGEALEAGLQTVLAFARASVTATRIRRNPSCRFAHESWSIDRIEAGPDDLSVGDVFGLGPGADCVTVAGQRFVHALTCTGCGGSRRLLEVTRQTRPDARRCGCGRPMASTGAHTTDSLVRTELEPATRAKKLSALGLLPGDVVSVGGAHFELGGRHAE